MGRFSRQLQKTLVGLGMGLPPTCRSFAMDSLGMISLR